MLNSYNESNLHYLHLHHHVIDYILRSLSATPFARPPFVGFCSDKLSCQLFAPLLCRSYCPSFTPTFSLFFILISLLLLRTSLLARPLRWPSSSSPCQFFRPSFVLALSLFFTPQCLRFLVSCLTIYISNKNKMSNMMDQKMNKNLNEGFS